VEFALVLPIFLLLVLGIINYGLFFNDSLNARQGVREAVRKVAVANFTLPAGSPASCSTSTTAAIKCITTSSVGALTGPVYVAVKPPATWARGSSVTICALVRPTGLTGLIPMPRSTRAITSMSIEVDSPTPTVMAAADTLPAGLSWPTGCT
jgi:Flp pilus assembly protein TadG